MAVALSQHGVKQQTSTSSFSITVTSVAANDIAVLAIRFFSNPGTATVSGLGATWTKQQSSNDGSTYCELWTGVGATSGTSISISTTSNTYSDTGWQIWGGGALIVSTNITGVIASTTTHRTSAAATTAANQGVAGFLISDNDHVSTNTYSFSDTPGSYTTQDASYDSSTAITVHSASRISGAADFEQRTGTLTTGAKYCGYTVVIGASGDSAYTVPTSGYVASTGASAGSGATIATSVPLATRTGNLMFAGVTIAQAGHKVTQPAGWTSMGSVAASGGGELFLFYRVAAPAEAGVPLTWTLDATDANAKAVALAVYAGVSGLPILMGTVSLVSGTVLNFSTQALKAGQSFLRIAGAYKSGSTTSLTWTSGSALTVTGREEDTGTGGTSTAALTSIADWTATAAPLSDSGNYVTAAATTSLVGATILLQSAITARDAQTQEYENVGLGVVAKQDAWTQVYENTGLGVAPLRDAWAQVYENVGLGAGVTALRDGWAQVYENIGLTAATPSRDGYTQVYENTQYTPNDNFASARQLVVPSGTGTVSGSDGQVTPTASYTVETGEPDQSGAATTSAWWYIIAGSGNVTIQGNNTSQGMLAVYTGSTLTGLTLVTYSSYWYSVTLSWTAIAGQQYYVQSVNGDTWNLTYTAHGSPILDAATFSPTRAGRSLTVSATVIATLDATVALTRTLTMSPTAVLDTYLNASLGVTRNRTLASGAAEYSPPPNDDFADAISLTPASGGSLAYANVLATREDEEPDSDTNTIWYVWTAPDAGSIDITTDVGAHSVGLFTGTTVADLVQVALPYFADVGEVYYASVYSGDVDAASGNLTWAFTSVTRGPGGAGEVDGTTGDLVLTVLDDPANVETPGILTVNLTNAAPSTNVDFYVDGVLVVSADSDDAGVIVSIGIPLDTMALGAHTANALNLSYVSNTASFTVTSGDTAADDPDDDPPTPIAPTPAVVQRWTLEDPATSEFYTFALNPLQMTSPFAERTFNLHATTGIQGQYLTFEGAPVAAPWRFSGKLLDQAQYDALAHWCAKKARIYLTDHYMRQWEVVLYHFDAKPNIKNYSHKWLTDYEVEAFITRGPL